MKAVCVSVAMLLVGCAMQTDFDTLYEYYFPKHGEYVNSSVYRRSFDKTLFGPPPPSSWRSRTREHYYAFHGNPKAFHAFVHNPDREADGEFGEEWVYECVLLLLRLGDDRFSYLLSLEDHKTREAVGVAIDTQIDWDKHQFPKTRALYAYRYVSPRSRLTKR